MESWLKEKAVYEKVLTHLRQGYFWNYGESMVNTE